MLAEFAQPVLERDFDITVGRNIALDHGFGQTYEQLIGALPQVPVIGRATALYLAGKGVRVVASDVDADGGKGLVESIRSSGGVAEFVVCDISSESSVGSWVAETTRNDDHDVQVNGGAGAEGR